MKRHNFRNTKYLIRRQQETGEEKIKIKLGQGSFKNQGSHSSLSIFTLRDT